ncbi:phage tail domain-containing protein [Actinopolymorpha pittospori]|uniref:Minor tail protein n=1 Tax=Actinopolymorpha pittospori TaxID=648752 RepID=A0A927R831_9ACTN|nr:phage tail domain-containing protein [Actinopolymorpha pittospori]MBE1606242.1 hypothetical protein [Actinopolymorpha pittospori]
MALDWFASVVWTGPDGRSWDLMNGSAETGVVILDEGVDGLGAAPRTITRRGIATGGTIARWSYAGERIITLPLMLYSAAGSDEFLTLRRDLTKAFTQTTPPAGVPRPGVLRIARRDGTWREVSAVYLDGFGWTDDSGRGVTDDVAVVQLVATDPWWYGALEVAVDFQAPAPRSYLSPYETVSPETAFGTQTVLVRGDAPASPVWTITGPATSVSVGIPGGPSWSFGAVTSGEVITVDVGASTVTDQTGANRIGDLGWPSSTLFTLPPGEVDIAVQMEGWQSSPTPSSVRLAYRPRLETA